MRVIILGLVFAILILIIIQKATSGFTAAECDARYTTDYQACNTEYNQATGKCSGKNAEKCRSDAATKKQDCLDKATDAKTRCLGSAAASGDSVAVQQVNQQKQQRRRLPATSAYSRPI